MKAVFLQPKITAIVTTVPKTKISLKDQVDTLYGGNIKQVERIIRSIGLEFRHISDDDMTTLDLCYHSAKKVIDHFKDIRIDALVCVTQTPDFLMPNNRVCLL